jgi:hypothetical protein
MNKKTVYTVVIVVLITLMVAPRLRALPGVSKLPTI